MSATEMLLWALGVSVVDVPGLDVQVCYVQDRRVALVRAGTEGEERLASLDWVLAELDAGSVTAPGAA